jgi:formylglycine-generating enzyme
MTVRTMPAASLLLVACGGPPGVDPPADAAPRPPCPWTCGFDGASDCCESPLVPGGTFYRGYDVGEDGAWPDTSNPATISDFRLDRYAVTVARFRAFVEAGQGTRAKPPPAGAGAHERIPGTGWVSGWDYSLASDTEALVSLLNCSDQIATWTPHPGPHERRPIICVSWHEAFAFCAWDGGRLPTQAEWNYAAAGGNEHRAYPWSSPPSSIEIDESRASYWVDSQRGCSGDMAPGCSINDIIPVGSKPAGDGRWGHSDLAGNVWEWLFDFANLEASFTTPCIDCVSRGPTTWRWIVGGRFNSGAERLRVGDPSIGASPDSRTAKGFRCARRA